MRGVGATTDWKSYFNKEGKVCSEVIIKDVVPEVEERYAARQEAAIREVEEWWVAKHKSLEAQVRHL